MYKCISHEYLVGCNTSPHPNFGAFEVACSRPSLHCDSCPIVLLQVIYTPNRILKQFFKGKTCDVNHTNQLHQTPSVIATQVKLFNCTNIVNFTRAPEGQNRLTVALRIAVRVPNMVQEVLGIFPAGTFNWSAELAVVALHLTRT